MRYPTLLLILGLTCYVAAVPLTEDSSDKTLQQTLDNGAREVNAASWSKDISNQRPPLQPEHRKSWLRHSKDWQREAEQQGLKRTTDEEAELETISSLLPDIGNSELNSGPEDLDDDDLQAELENFNVVHRAPAEDEDNNEDRLMSDEVEAQKWRLFRSILGKGLRVLKHKLRSRSRTPEEDRRAVNNPTSLKDLARNVLGTVGDKLDPRDMEDVSNRLTSEEAEIEKLKIFKKLFKKVKKVAKKAFKIVRKVKPLFKSRRRSRDRDEDDDCRQPYKYANIEYKTPIRTDGGFYNERELAEIEGFRSVLVNALRLVDTKLRPRSRTVEEDRDAVRYPKITTEFPTDAVPYEGQPWTTDLTDMAAQTQSLYKIFIKLWSRLRRNRSG